MEKNILRSEDKMVELHFEINLPECKTFKESHTNIWGSNHNDAGIDCHLEPGK